MAESAGNGYAVSAVNRDLMRKGAYFLVGLGVIVAVLMIILPSRYYFSVQHGTVSLYSAKIPGFIPQPVKGYTNIPVGSEAIRSFAKTSFTTPEEAVAALKEFLAGQIQQQKEAVAEVEQALADAYKSYLPDLQGAKVLGVKGLDVSIEAIEGWVAYQSGQSESGEASSGHASE